MNKIKHALNKEFYLGIIYTFLFFIFLIPLYSYCYEPTKTIIITKEDIDNSIPNSPYNINFSQKELKTIKMLEKRHFEKTFENLDDSTRLLQLEYELLGKCWKYSPKEDRIKKLEIASSNYMLSGASLPATISSKENAKKMSSDTIVKKDNVGLIDGFLRLMSPEKYEIYRKYSQDLYNKYDY